MAWNRLRFARTTEALRAVTTYMRGEPIIPTDGANANRLFIGDGAMVGGRAIAFKDELAATAIPIGALVDYTGATLPSGYLWPDGRNVSRTTYAALFDAIGTTYGAGDGSTTFTLPDARGRVTAGRDNLGGTAANRLTSAVSGLDGAALGAGGGDQRMQSHAHDLKVSNVGAAGTAIGVPWSGGTTNTTGISLTAGGGASQNVQPTLVLNKIIYAGA